MRPSLLGYFAGAIDADGFITIQRSRKNGAVYFTAKVGFTGTATPHEAHTLLQEAFGGSVCTYVPKYKNYKPVHSWCVSNKLAKKTLRAILPYLVTKRGQAGLVLEFISTCERQWKEVKRTQVPTYRIPPEMVAVRNNFYERVTALNSPRNRRVNLVSA